jgi:ATP-dependent helicase YprA (DUF1998 family)
MMLTSVNSVLNFASDASSMKSIYCNLPISVSYKNSLACSLSLLLHYNILLIIHYIVLKMHNQSDGTIFIFFGLFDCSQKCPSQAVSIRAICPEKYTVINQATNEVIEEVEESKAFFEVYEGAVYMHQGKTYLCRSLDIAAKVALCQEADLKYYTKTRDFTDVHVLGGELVL